jgi:hypothetical protein
LTWRLDELGDTFEDGRVYLERAGLEHYKEVKFDMHRKWTDPWAEAKA